MVSYNEAIESRRKQAELIRKWLKNKSVKQWRRCLYLLYVVGEPVPTSDVAHSLGCLHGSVYRVLKKMQISSSVKEIRKRKKGKIELTWEITNHGEKEILRCQKNKIVPSFNR